MSDTPQMPKLPEPSFRLKWRDGAYYVTKPEISDTDVFTPEQVATIQRESFKAGMLRAAEISDQMLAELGDVEAKGGYIGKACAAATCLVVAISTAIISEANTIKD